MKKARCVWGLLLILIGVLWILTATGSVRLDLIGSVKTLWPVFVIAGGITLLLNKEARVAKAVVWVLAAALICSYGLYLGNYGDLIPEDTDVNVYELKDGMESAKLELNAGAADLRIGAADSVLARVNTDIKGLSSSYRDGRESLIRYYQKWRPFDFGSGSDFYADLNGTVRWSLEFNTGSTDGIIDFSGFPLETCEISTGACDLRIVAGSMQDEASIKCNAGAVTMSISIPQGSGIRIESNAAVNEVQGNGISVVKKAGTTNPQISIPPTGS